MKQSSSIRDIKDTESERDRLQQQAHERRATLNARAEEFSQLSTRIERLTNILEHHAAEAQRVQEEFVRERDTLTGKLNELQELFDKADSQMKAQQNALKECDRKIADLNNPVDNQTAGLDSKHHVSELKEAIDAKSASMYIQANTHAKICEELNARIVSITGELEALHAMHGELGTHAEKHENLNRAPHGSTTSENALHEKVLEEMAGEILLLRLKLEVANESLEGQPDNTAALENLQQVLYDLESRMDETDERNQVLAEKAKAAEELEAEIARLRTALREARDSASQSAADAQSLQSLQGWVADLQSALESSRAEQGVLAGKLRDHDALEQELMNLRAAVRQTNNKQLDQGGVSGTVDALRDEAEKLRTALRASEQKCEQLQAALSSAAKSDGARATDQSQATQELYPATIINRTQFVSCLNNHLAEQDRSDVNFTVMYVLVDNFIRIRDEVGIMNSEHVMEDISGIIASFCDGDDILAQFGESTFAVLSSNESLDETQEKANRIHSTIENHIFESAGRSLITTTSIGICTIRKNDTSAEEVVSRADLACEVARSSGGNQVLVNSTIADEVINLGTNANHDEMVSRTLAENRIKIYYQPISSLKDLPGNHYEVLIRIVDESGSIILPGEFFAMAANSGHAVDIDLYVIDNIMKMISENRDQEMTLFIKLTRQSVADHELPVWIMRKIKEHRINPKQLVFEVPESVLQNDLKNLSMLSKALNAIGCKIAIEHYRMSTQPQHLQHIHADYLKIDSGLVQGISRKGEGLSKVIAIMDIARDHNLITIAEGVESADCLVILWELGVCFAQGYFIQVPAGNRNYDFQGKISENDAVASNKATYSIG